MSLYLDTSAAAKLLVLEPESSALLSHLEGVRRRGEELVSSALLETELRRLAGRVGVPQTAASEVLARIALAEPDRALFTAAGLLPGPKVPSLDALHVATALRLQVSGVVTALRPGDLLGARGPTLEAAHRVGGDMSVTTPQGGEQSVTWEEYQALPEDPRCEYIDGRLVVSPSPDLRHQEISVDLVVALRAVLPATHRVTFTWEWKPAQDAFIPDVIVFPVAQQTVPQRFTGTPSLVVEVLSGNRGDDLLVKMTKYAAAGLPRYWIVDPREDTVTTYVLDDSGAFRPTRVLTAGGGVVDLDLGVATLPLDVAALLRAPDPRVP